MNYQPDKLYQGIILKKVIYRETSIICNILTPQDGKITLLAKGVRQSKNPAFGLLQILAELEFSTHRKKDSEWHILKTCELKQTYENASFQTTAILQAGAELFDQMIIPVPEATTYYILLKNYLSYTHNFDNNSIALFWRLLLRVFELNGITLDLMHCVSCGKETSLFNGYHLQKQGFICPQCENDAFPLMIEKITTEEKDLLNILPAIGIKLDSIAISPQAAKQITRILMSHLNLHFNDHFNLKSLKLI
ncbi:MAG: DNA repair protein RecO [Candidatus Stygibacter frigidus]|nr:DNA repair protein RecO [Candidatus Stygibacter frigidus]